MNELTLAGKVLLSPGDAAIAIQEHTHFTFPLVVLIVATIAELFWLHRRRDRWLKDHRQCQ